MSNIKHLARKICRETLADADVARAIGRKLSRTGSRIQFGAASRLANHPAGAHHSVTNADCEIDLSPFDELRVVAFGKAAHSMVEGFARLLAPEFRLAGIVSAPAPPLRPLPGLAYFVGGHPIPNEASLEAGGAILELLGRCTERTLVFFLLSGGGSALVEWPLDPAFTLEDLQALNRLLVGCGASIDEINAVRKHLSAVKGGRLAAAAPLSARVTYAVTDVPEGKDSALASGPTLPDPTRVADMQRVIDRFGLRDKLPARIREFLARNNIPETPKPDHPTFARAQFQILLGTHDLFHRAHHHSEAAGFITICDNTTDDWPISRAVDYLLAQLAEHQRNNPGRRVALISDGEVSSPVTGDGTGGRNSAFVLACVEKIAGTKIAALSTGTDGVDGSSLAAGAVADGDTLARAKAMNLDPGDFLRHSDSNTFFQRLGDTVVTGPTGNNLRDLRILLAERLESE